MYIAYVLRMTCAIPENYTFMHCSFCDWWVRYQISIVISFSCIFGFACLQLINPICSRFSALIKIEPNTNIKLSNSCTFTSECFTREVRNILVRDYLMIFVDRHSRRDFRFARTLKIFVFACIQLPNSKTDNIQGPYCLPQTINQFE